jgi:3-deoxy-manno-octulosonate cytidylyltransferase (CMP-KDO synthetase)
MSFHMQPLVVIPARFESSRLPGKPLVPLCGVPMIVRTWLQCAKAIDADRIVVATDDARIESVCAENGITALRTSAHCLTGTDRVAEVATRIKASTYINVQGDEPVFNPADLKELIDAAARHPGEVLNGMCVITKEEEFRSTTVPKVVARPDGRLLYMSRASIPTGKDLRFSSASRQVCAYAFPAKALRDFTTVPAKTPLEQVEDIEILRFLELGYEVRMLPMSDQSIAVDVPADIPRAESRIRELGLA